MNAPARTFEAKAAVRREVPLLIGLMSPSGGGKTYSALRLATGMQQVYGGDIYGIDTENNRMLHYADQFKFKHVPFGAPFGSLDYLAALKWCNAQGARITIVDSMTHEHSGEGGYLETAENVINRIAGDDYAKRERAKFAGLAQAAPLRTKMIEGIKQFDGAFIFCWRAKQKVKPLRIDGKMQAVEMGLMPIGGEEWVYEMIVNCMLPARAGGVPLWRADHVGEKLIMKLPKQFETIFEKEQPLSEDIGRKLAEWAKGGSSPGPTPRPAAPAPEAQSPSEVGAEPSDVLARLDEVLALAATHGMDALEDVWKGLPAEHKPTLKAALDRRHKATAREVDEQAGRSPRP